MKGQLYSRKGKIILLKNIRIVIRILIQLSNYTKGRNKLGKTNKLFKRSYFFDTSG
ncbi:hypothetical protein MTR67_031329 [Solanum verrucosum]|uniref:Uncharacterized protein n=1 Tax=Solanum verrucosum TaxID=315347 RepID=A0AAF0U2F5_SOLVR|nr:hypothetical protein MTR67_031329 [Solanum verrucosum]